MRSLRARLILVFLAAVLVPLAGALWITQSLLEHSLTYADPRPLDELSRLLEKTGREYYQRNRELLRLDAESGKAAPRRFPDQQRKTWPSAIESFVLSGEQERFLIAGARGDEIQYLVRKPAEVQMFTRKLGEVGMTQLTEQYRRAREMVGAADGRDLRRGFFYASLILFAAVCVISLAAMILLANHVSRPIRQLTAALSTLASGDLTVRVPESGADEVGAAMTAFNRMAGQLEQSRERLIYLTQVASWQRLARKMAHEVKNSLTPIRLNVEEMVARAGPADRQFMAQASQIIVDEIGVLERRIRAFSELGAEPPVKPVVMDLNNAVEERVSFLKQARPDVVYQIRTDGRPRASADADLLRGILTNLLENAAHAAGPGGVVLVKTLLCGRHACVEVHDSGPGLSPEARKSLFEPTISFKKGGMGIGLSIARKSALSCGGDIIHLEGELGGAGFRVLLPSAT